MLAFRCGCLTHGSAYVGGYGMLAFVSASVTRTRTARRKESMKRRILLVDDEVAVLLTLKAVLEISGFDVDTATSAREGKSRIKHREYEMVITDLRMEEEHAGLDVIAAAKEAAYRPAIALLTAFPQGDDEADTLGADKMLIKPMHTRVLLQQIESLMTRHSAAKDKAARKAIGKSVAGKRVAKERKATAEKIPARAGKPAATASKGAAGEKKAPPAKRATEKAALTGKKA